MLTGCAHVVTYVLWSSESHASDTLNVLQTELGNRFPGLLLVPGVDCDRGSGGDVGVALSVVVVRVRAILRVLDLGYLLLILVWELFYSWVGHDDCMWLRSELELATLAANWCAIGLSD